MTKEFIVTCVAGSYALGVILSRGEIGKDHPIAYASRSLRGAELNYSTYDRELLVIIFAKDQFRPFLYGKPFVLISDHEPLKFY